MQYELGRILDAYSGFDYKAAFTSNNPPQTPPQWIPKDEQRRLRSYSVLESYCRNHSRSWLQAIDYRTGELSDAASNRREYGDPALIVETALSSLMGNSTAIVTQDAVSGDQAAVAQQLVLEQWATDEKFTIKNWECERMAVKYGDGVYALGWDSTTGRPRLNVYDPGFYFPVFDPRAAGNEEFPSKVHLAWEFETENADGKTTTYVRRITWELIEVEAPYDPGYEGAEEMAYRNCWFTDGIWELSEIGKGLSSFNPQRVDWLNEGTWLNFDFIPVVHIPNTVSLQNHYGASVLANIMQILDDVQSTDTDLQASAATTGSPPIVVSGKGAGSSTINSYGPGSVIYVGDGSASIMDTSTSLDALIKLKDALLSRLSINSRTPEALLGRVKPNEVPSGIALTLGFTPHIGMIREMRKVRLDKYS